MNINKTLIILFIAPSFIAHAFAQNPDIVWSKSYGGNDVEYTYCVRPTVDGGTIAGGYTYSTDGDITAYHGLTDIWIVKLDDTGELEWQRSYGGSEYELVDQIEQTADGGYIFAGSTSSTDGDVTGLHGQGDGWVVKIDSIGNIQWQRCYGGSGTDGITSFVINDNNYVFLGYALSMDGDLSNNTSHGLRDVWLIKTDSTGNIISSYTYGSSSYDAGNSICNAPSGGYVLLCDVTAGDGDASNSNYHPFSQDYWILMVDSAGEIQYSKCFGGSSLEIAKSIQSTSDGGYVAIGDSYSINGDITDHHGSGIFPDYWVIKLDSTGSLMWQKSIGGTDADAPYSVIESSGNLFIGGLTSSNDGDVINNHGEFQVDGWLVKLSSDGNILWQNSYGGSSSDAIFAISQSSDGAFVCAGVSSSSDGDVFSNNGFADYWIFELSPTTAITEPVTENSFLVFPNPAMNEINVSYASQEDLLLTINDLLGKELKRITLYPSFKNEKVDISDLPEGIYLLVMQQPGNVLASQKLVIVR